jgi:class 3 adenylate cyclase/HD superfamily phosphodiesterase
VFSDAGGKVLCRLGTGEGLYSNEALQVFADAGQNLWVLHEHAVTRVELNSPFTSFDARNGLTGNVKDILLCSDCMYAATSHGIFRLNKANPLSGSAAENAMFRRIQGVDSDGRTLAARGTTLYAGTFDGLYEISEQSIQRILQVPVNDLLIIPGKNIILVGTDSGLRIFEIGTWEETRHFSLPDISIDQVELSPDQTLWLSSKTGILFRSTEPFNHPVQPEYESYTSDLLGHRKGSFTGLMKTSRGLLFSVPGEFRLFDPVSDSFPIDTLIISPEYKPSSNFTDLKEDPDGRLWVCVNGSDGKGTRMWSAKPGQDGKYVFEPVVYHRLDQRMLNRMYPDPDGILWIATNEELLRYDPSLRKDLKAGWKIYVSRFLTGERLQNDLTSNLHQPGDHPARFKLANKENRIRAEFFATGHTCESGPLYQYSLDEDKRGWSGWSDIPYAEFNGLKKGRYDLRIRSQDIFGNLSEIKAISFRIKAPFYFSWYSVIVYVLFLAAMFFALQRWQSLQQIRNQIHLEEVVQERTETLIKEKEKAEDLLSNILPKTTAEELKTSGKATSSKFKMCTVLFADIQGFTKIAEEMNPDRLIDQLDRFYYHFDSVVEKYNIEKIKTIGDAYMAAGGIPVKNRTNPVDVVLAALEMQQYMKELKKSQADIWDLRIGIHTGSVIAGVVGQKKFSYDIWGDTVNTASRMESSGEVGRVNISATTYKLIKDFFQCEYRGKMPVKYKGDIAMFFVNGLNPTFSEADRITPNDKFYIQIQLLRLLDLEEFILEKLKNELPEELLFHNVQHTSHVYSQVELLGRGERVSDEDLLLLQTAALLHDTGYIDGMENHEERSVQYAYEILPVYRYREDQIEKICQLILATRMPPQPQNLLEQIICDANLDHLGRVDFLIQSDKLFQEYRMKNKIRSKKEWNQSQINFLSNHEFYTSIANRMREVTKEQQIENIRQFS